MDFKQLQYFIAIVQEQNLTKAANKLFVSQSTLSLFLSRLEEDLGTKLFVRQKNRLIITEDGILVYNTAKKILNMRDDLYVKLRSRTEKESLKLGIASQSVIRTFARTMQHQKENFPNIDIRITEGRTSTMVDKILKGELDAAIVGNETTSLNEFLDVRIIQQEEFGFVLPPNHLLAHLASQDYDHPPIVDITQFNHCDVLLPPSDTCDYRIATNLFNDYNLNVNVACQINDAQTQLFLSKEKMYINIWPLHATPRDQGLLVCRPDRSYCRYLLLIKQKGSIFSSNIEKFLDILIQDYLNIRETYKNKKPCQ